MNFETFIPLFLLLIIAGTLAITGWYLITRGELEVQPDNTLKKTGNIFKGFYFFFMREKKEKETIIYSGRQLELLLQNEIRPNYPLACVLSQTASYALLFEKDENWMNHKIRLEEILNVRLVEFKDEVWVYAEYPNYVFPEWVRDPIAVCPTCMASVYGSIFYWTCINIVRVDLFAWSNLPILASFLFWIAFCFSLSVTNTYIAKKVRK